MGLFLGLRGFEANHTTQKKSEFEIFNGYIELVVLCVRAHKMRSVFRILNCNTQFLFNCTAIASNILC